MKSGWLPNASSAGDTFKNRMPLPDRLADCGLLPAESCTVIDPVLAPVVVGLNVTRIEQLAPLERLLPQLFVCAKSPAAWMLEMVIDELRLLCSVRKPGLLVVPTTSLPKLRLAGESATGGTPVPLRLTF